MKEKNKNSQNHVSFEKKINNNLSEQSQATTSNSLQEFVEHTVKTISPDINLQDSKTVILTFIEHYSNMEDTVEIVKRLLKILLSKLNNNQEINYILNQLKNNQTHDKKKPDNSQQETAINTIAEFIKTNKIEGDKYTKFQNVFASLVNMFSNQDINQDTLESVFKIMNIDSNIDDSFKKGILEGRNQKIQEQLSQYTTEDGLYSTNSNYQKIQSNNDGYIERLLNGRK